MLQNAPFLAIVAVDTDENEPSKVRQLDNWVRLFIGLYRGWLRNNMAKHAIWKHPKFLYGHEMLLLAPSDETAMQRTGFKAILDEESEFFKSRWGWLPALEILQPEFYTTFTATFS